MDVREHCNAISMIRHPEHHCVSALVSVMEKP
jgi:hypothetical protein